MPAISPVAVLTGMLLAAIVGGAAAKWVGVPRVVGYLVGGTMLRLGTFAVFDAPDPDAMAGSVNLVTDIALGLILFTIGSVFESKRLKSTWHTLRQLSLWEILMTGLLTGAGCALASWILPGMTVTLSISLGLLLGTTAIATAPAATYLVLREYEAKGPTTDHLLGMTGLNNLVSILSFNVALLLCAWLGWEPEGAGGRAGLLMLEFLLMSLGSLFLGLFMGMILSALHERMSLESIILLFLANLMLVWAVDGWLRQTYDISFNPLVTFLAMGATFANLALNPQRFEQALGMTSAPVFAVFFVLAGFKLHVEALPDLGLLGITYIAMRMVGKIAGVRLGVRRVGAAAFVRPGAGVGLLCQAGVAIGLGELLMGRWGDNDWSRTVNTVILASVVMNELIGPILVKRTVVRAGEVKVITLLRRGAPRVNGKRPVTALSRILRRYFFRTGKVKAAPEVLVAKHVMRTNVRVLPAGADFDEVLHFVERSHMNDFPVIDSESHYVGLVHFRSIRDLMYDPAFSHLVTAGDLADESVAAVTADTELASLLEIFAKHNVGALVVVDHPDSPRLRGIVEQRDVLRAMHTGGGAGDRGRVSAGGGRGDERARDAGD